MTAPNLLDPLGSGEGAGLAKLHLGHLSKEIPAGVLLGSSSHLTKALRKSASQKTKTQADNNLCKIIALPYQVSGSGSPSPKSKKKVSLALAY